MSGVGAMRRRPREDDLVQSTEAAMTAQAINGTKDHIGQVCASQDARAQLLSMMPVMERRIELSGISTAVLEGGDGPPLVLLHGPNFYAAVWLQIVPRLARSHRIVAPDLPGHSNSVVPGGAIDTNRVLDWLGALIDRTCPSPPALVGQTLGGAIAARFASRHSDRLRQLVLDDTLGLAPFEPAPGFGHALMEFTGRPSEETHDSLWRQCAHDLHRMRARMGAGWKADQGLQPRSRPHCIAPCNPAKPDAAVGLSPIPPSSLGGITVPTALIWGRHNLAIPLAVAEAARERYGWPLHTIEDCADDPPVEQPDAFLKALDRALGRP
jgi:pimeloyl-ACP methyl ester carboxylesterase